MHIIYRNKTILLKILFSFGTILLIVGNIDIKAPYIGNIKAFVNMNIIINNSIRFQYIIFKK